ncbi:hypothetical protein BJ741DRAFT_190725 [Chytriomyces cf. hyalinus JEL632]|nr:hypothetical protein BJ741DRAFT_190725 [Chytriomyces cf. hyalinus JEL632]
MKRLQSKRISSLQYRDPRPAASSTALSDIATSSRARVSRRRRANLPFERIVRAEIGEYEDEVLAEGYVFPLGANSIPIQRPNPVRIYERLHRNEVIQEIICDGISVMRRKSDGHVNANHIMRLAGLSDLQAQRAMRDLAYRSKAKPLIVRDGGSALHGKWFPAKESKQLAQEYKLFERLRPLFE